MWIKTEKESLQKLSTPETDGIVEFSENGTAQVSEDVAEQLISEFDGISEHETEDN